MIQYSTGGGKDTIIGFGEDDSIQISGSYTTQQSGNNTVIKVGSGSITLKDYTGDVYFYDNAVSGGNGLLFDDNFIGENNLDSIVENKFAVTEIETQTENLAQDEFKLTYSK